MLVTSSDEVALPIAAPIATQAALRTIAFSSLISVVIILVNSCLSVNVFPNATIPSCVFLLDNSALIPCMI